MLKLLGFALCAVALCVFGVRYCAVLDKRLGAYRAIASLCAYIRDRMNAFPDTLCAMLRDFEPTDEIAVRLRDAAMTQGADISALLPNCDGSDAEMLCRFLCEFGTDTVECERARCETLAKASSARLAEVSEQVGQSRKLTRVLILTALCGLLILVI